MFGPEAEIGPPQKGRESSMAAKTSSDKSTKSSAMHVFDFMNAALPSPMPAVVACFGADDFLRRIAVQRTKQLSQLDVETIRVYEGEEDAWRDVHDELATQSLFDTRGERMAVVRSADKFVTKNREALERWTEKATPNSCLVLELQTLAANTRLYKLISTHGLLVNCTPPQKSSWGNPPDEKALQQWAMSWAQAQHTFKLTSKQAALIVERIGGVCGLIDCELAKLRLFADDSGNVSDARVAELVGGWRTQTAWELADAIADGNVAKAMEQIDKLMAAGQNAVGLLAQLSWSLRRYGLAAQLIEQSERTSGRIPLNVALERAGFNRFDVAKAETRIKRMGRARAKELLANLVDLELKLKGSHSQEQRARFGLEALIMKLG
jgi:DNA polymerase-3 subunit delta